MVQTRSQRDLPSDRVVPVRNIQTSEFISATQGPVVNCLSILYFTIPLILMPLLVLFGSHSKIAAIITFSIIASLMPYALLDLIRFIIKTVKKLFNILFST